MFRAPTPVHRDDRPPKLRRLFLGFRGCFRMGVPFSEFLDLRRLLIDIFEQLAGFLGCSHHAGAQEDQQFDVARRLVLLFESPAEAGNAPEPGHFPHGVRRLFLNDAAQHERFAALGGDVGLEISSVQNGAAKQGLTGFDGGGFDADLERHVAGDIDVRDDLQDDADVLVGETLIQGADIGALAFVDERHL